jgi:hypothetical protein
MANDNIFQQYLTPPKSVLEYSAEMDQADTRKQSLQTNALKLAAGQQASQRAEQLRTALLGLPQGATDDQRIQAMRGTATPEGFAAADALDKSLTERRKGNAAAKKDEADAARTNLTRDVALHDFHAQRLATIQTPEDALAWAQEGNALGLFKQPGQYDRGIAAIQQAAQDPQTFAQWKAAAMQGGQSVTEQLKQQLEQVKQAEQVRQFGVTDQRVRSEGAANRAQSDRHFNAGQENSKGQIVQTDSGPVLVNTRTGAGKVVTGPDGEALAGITKPLNDSQSKALLFGTRMQEAHKVLNQLAGEGTTTSVPGSRLPLVGGAINAMSSGNNQMLDQAKRDFMTAVLRRESGAAISSGEFDTADKQYFPQLGDSAQVIAQKARNRDLAIKGVLIEVPQKQRASITPGAPAASGAPAAPRGKPSLSDIFGK